MKNAEAAISCQKGGVNSLRTGGWGGNFRTGKLPIFLFFFGGGGGVLIFSGGINILLHAMCQFYYSFIYPSKKYWDNFGDISLS